MVADGRASRLAFSPHVTTAGSSIWMRHLLLDGKEALALGGSCDTCPFFFERLEGANETVSPAAAVSHALRAGVDQLEPELLEQLGRIIPAGAYRACLVELEPVLVWPGDDADYFRHEHVELWGVDPFWGLPHHPRTPYYRSSDIAIAPGERLFEFVVPMVPPRWLDADQVAAYRRTAKGTALATGVLDVRAPVAWHGNAEPYVGNERRSRGSCATGASPSTYSTDTTRSTPLPSRRGRSASSLCWRSTRGFRRRMRSSRR